MTPPADLGRIGGKPHGIQKRHRLLDRRIRRMNIRIRLPNPVETHRHLHHCRPRRPSRRVRHQKRSLVARAGCGIETCDCELALDGDFGLLVHAAEVEFCQVEFCGGSGYGEGGWELVWSAEVVDGVVEGGLGDDAAGFLVLDGEV